MAGRLPSQGIYRCSIGNHYDHIGTGVGKAIRGYICSILGASGKLLRIFPVIFLAGFSVDGTGWNLGKVEKISTAGIWWNLALLFFASFLPYATGLVSSNYDSKVMQGFYGLIVILTTSCNWFLHKLIDFPNKDNKELLEITAEYRKLLLPDIWIKVVGMIMGMLFYPPLVSYIVLIADAYIIGLRQFFLVKRIRAKR